EPHRTPKIAKTSVGRYRAFPRRTRVSEPTSSATAQRKRPSMFRRGERLAESHHTVVAEPMLDLWRRCTARIDDVGDPSRCAGARDVGRQIVEEEDVLRRNGEHLPGTGIDLGIRLEAAEFVRREFDVELGEAGELRIRGGRTHPPPMRHAGVAQARGAAPRGPDAIEQRPDAGVLFDEPDVVDRLDVARGVTARRDVRERLEIVVAGQLAPLIAVDEATSLVEPGLARGIRFEGEPCERTGLGP